MAQFSSAEIAITAKDKTKPGLSSAKKGVGGLTKAVKSYGAEIGAAVAAVYGAIKIVNNLTDAYKIQEAAIAKVEAALKATGTYTPTLSNNLQELASQLQSVTTYGDESTLEMTALLQSLAKLNEEQLTQIIPSIQDFATGMGIDLNTAASLVGKTLGSTTNALSRYGIVIDMTGTKEEKLQELTEAINGSFGGMAEAMGKTYTGKVKILQNAFGDLKEEMGRTLADNMEPMLPVITRMITVTKDWIKQKNDLREAYKLLEKPMEVFNEQTRLEVLQAEQLVAIDKLKALRKQAELEVSTSIVGSIKKEISGVYDS